MAIKVLLVEDDRALREALADTLLLAGHDYRAVGSAEEALEAVEQESFSLVVSDVNMPGMDGHQLLGLLRARQPQLPVLLITAHGAVERAVGALHQLELAGAVPRAELRLKAGVYVRLGRRLEGFCARLEECFPAADAASEELLERALALDGDAARRARAESASAGVEPDHTSDAPER